MLLLPVHLDSYRQLETRSLDVNLEGRRSQKLDLLDKGAKQISDVCRYLYVGPNPTKNRKKKKKTIGGCLKRSKTEKMEKKVKKIGVFLTKKRVRGVGSSHRGV